MIQLVSRYDNQIVLNPDEIESMTECPGSIGMYSSYTRIHMKSGEDHEVLASIWAIRKEIERSKE